MEEPAALAEPALEVVDEILAPDRPARLSRGPRRERAPVRALAAPRCEGSSETRIAVGDLEVAECQVRQRRDPPDLVHARCVRLGRHDESLAPLTHRGRREYRLRAWSPPTRSPPSRSSPPSARSS